MNIKLFGFYILFVLLLISPSFAQPQRNSQKLDTKKTKFIIDSLSRALQRWYVYPEKATLMISNVKKITKAVPTMWFRTETK